MIIKERKELLAVMKNKLIILVVSLVMTLSFSYPAFAIDGTAAGPDYGPNAKAAISEFGIDENCVEIASKNDTVSTLNEMIMGIAPDASESNPGMIYVPEGTFNVSSTLKVLPNVVLVSESGVVFKSTSSANMIKLSGSVYGGVFDKQSRTGNIILYDNITFKGKNGIVKKTNLKNTNLTAVQINGAARNAKVLNNTISNCKKNGISSYRAGHFAAISGNKISNIGKGGGGSGIDIVQSDVSEISNNTISSCKGHGISTDTETFGIAKKSVVLGKVTGNKISNTNHHGIWLEKGSKITGGLDNNTISNATSNDLGLDKNTSVNIMNGNTFTSAKHALVMVSAKKSVLNVGSNNIFKNGKAAGIAIGKKGRVTIKGSNNLITRNKKNGIQIDKYGVLVITGKTTITKNRWGINMMKKGRATIKNCIIKSNKKGAVYYIKGAKFKKSKCKVKGKIYKQK